MSKLQKCLIKVKNKHCNNALMMIKKENHNIGFSNGVERFLIENLIKYFKNGALSRYLIRSIKKCFIINFIKNLKTN